MARDHGARYARSMAPRRMKVFLPRWIRWVLPPFFVVIWALMTWLVWFSGEIQEQEDVIGWWIATFVLLFVAGLLWAMTSGKLAAYEIELDLDDESR